MNKFKKYASSTMQFLHETPTFLFFISLLFGISFEAFYIVRLAEQSTSISPETEKIVMEFLTTPLGSHLFLGASFGSIMLFSLVFFFAFHHVLEFILSVFGSSKADTY